jgi:hypothetical protein
MVTPKKVTQRGSLAGTSDPSLGVPLIDSLYKYSTMIYSIVNKHSRIIREQVALKRPPKKLRTPPLVHAEMAMASEAGFRRRSPHSPPVRDRMDQRVVAHGSLWALANSCLRNALLIWICAVYVGLLSQTESDTHSWTFPASIDR